MLSTLEAAKLLGVSSIRVRNLIYDGALPARKVGRSWVLREEDVMARLERRPGPGRPRKEAAKRTSSEESSCKPELTRLHDLYASCKASLARSPSAAEIDAIEDAEEAAFRIAVADFFLQRKQAELVRQGAF